MRLRTIFTALLCALKLLDDSKLVRFLWGMTTLTNVVRATLYATFKSPPGNLEDPPDVLTCRNANFVLYPPFFQQRPKTIMSHFPEKFPSLPIPGKISTEIFGIIFCCSFVEFLCLFLVWFIFCMRTNTSPGVN